MTLFRSCSVNSLPRCHFRSSLPLRRSLHSLIASSDSLPAYDRCYDGLWRTLRACKLFDAFGLFGSFFSANFCFVRVYANLANTLPLHPRLPHFFYEQKKKKIGVLLVSCFQHAAHSRFSAWACVALVLASTSLATFRHTPRFIEYVLCPASAVISVIAFLVLQWAVAPELRIPSALTSTSLVPTIIVLAHRSAQLYGIDMALPWWASQVMAGVGSNLYVLPICAVALAILALWIDLAYSVLEGATTRAEAIQMAGMARQVASRLPPELVARILKPASDSEEDRHSDDAQLNGWQTYLSLADEVSHQARTYETNSAGFIQMLLDTNLNGGQEELLLNLQQSLAYSSRMLQCAILFFKADAGILALDLSSSIDCQQIFDLTLSELSETLEHNMNVNVVRRVDPEFPFLFGDTTYLMTIIRLLLENASQYTMQGHITLSARVLERSWSSKEDHTDGEEFALVEFGVTDTGCGIPAAQMPFLKTPFSTKDDIFWSAQQVRGAGLGIPTASSLARCFPEGRLDIESTENVGTSVRVRLRLRIDTLRMAEQIGFELSNAQLSSPISNLIVSHSIIDNRPCKLAVFAPEPIFASLQGMLAPHGFLVKHIISRGSNSMDLAFEVRQAMLQKDAYKAVLIDAHAFGASPHHNERVLSLASTIKNDPITSSTPIALIIHAGHFVGKSRLDGAIFDECILKPLLCQQVHATVRRMIIGNEDIGLLDPRFIRSPLNDEEEYEAQDLNEENFTRSNAPLATGLGASGSLNHSSSISGISNPPLAAIGRGGSEILTNTNQTTASSFARFRRHSIDANLSSYSQTGANNAIESSDSKPLTSSNALAEIETSKNNLALSSPAHGDYIAPSNSTDPTLPSPTSLSSASRPPHLADLPETCESVESSPRTPTSGIAHNSVEDLVLLPSNGSSASSSPRDRKSSTGEILRLRLQQSLSSGMPPHLSLNNTPISSSNAPLRPTSSLSSSASSQHSAPSPLGVPAPRLGRRSRTTVDAATVSAYHNWKDVQTTPESREEYSSGSSGSLLRPNSLSQSQQQTSSSQNANHLQNSTHQSGHAISHGRRLLILIIEDDATNRLVLSKMVTHMGHESIVAENGAEGLEIFKQRYEQIDTIIMDYRMPKMDGVQATLAIREFETRAGQSEPVPIVGLSADDSVRSKCLSAGMDSCWTKPLKPQSLQVVLLQRLMHGANKTRFSNSASLSSGSTSTNLTHNHNNTSSLSASTAAPTPPMLRSRTQPSELVPTPPLAKGTLANHSGQNSPQVTVLDQAQGSPTRKTPNTTSAAAETGSTLHTLLSGPSDASKSHAGANSNTHTAIQANGNGFGLTCIHEQAEQKDDISGLEKSPLTASPEHASNCAACKVSPGKTCGAELLDSSASSPNGYPQSTDKDSPLPNGTPAATPPPFASEASSATVSSGASALQATASAQDTPPKTSSWRQILSPSHYLSLLPHQSSSPSSQGHDSETSDSKAAKSNSSSAQKDSATHTSNQLESKQVRKDSKGRIQPIAPVKPSTSVLPKVAGSIKEFPVRESKELGSSSTMAPSITLPSSTSLVAAPKASNIALAHRKRGVGAIENMPLHSSPSPASPSSVANNTALVPAHGERILLVEDNLTVAKIAMTVLARNKQPAELATDGQEAYERVSRDHSAFSVVLMDIHLPLVDGFECTSLIREFERQYNLPPLFIIALTGEQRFIDPDTYLSTGFNHFLRKPVNYQVLIAQLPVFRAHHSNMSSTSISSAIAGADEASDRALLR